MPCDLHEEYLDEVVGQWRACVQLCPVGHSDPVYCDGNHGCTNYLKCFSATATTTTTTTRTATIHNIPPHKPAATVSPTFSRVDDGGFVAVIMLTIIIVLITIGFVVLLFLRVRKRLCGQSLNTDEQFHSTVATQSPTDITHFTAASPVDDADEVIETTSFVSPGALESISFPNLEDSHIALRGVDDTIDIYRYQPEGRYGSPVNVATTTTHGITSHHEQLQNPAPVSSAQIQPPHIPHQQQPSRHSAQSTAADADASQPSVIADGQSHAASPTHAFSAHRASDISITSVDSVSVYSMSSVPVRYYTSDSGDSLSSGPSITTWANIPRSLREELANVRSVRVYNAELTEQHHLLITIIGTSVGEARNAINGETRLGDNDYLVRLILEPPRYVPANRPILM